MSVNEHADEHANEQVDVNKHAHEHTGDVGEVDGAESGAPGRSTAARGECVYVHLCIRQVCYAWVSVWQCVMCQAVQVGLRLSVHVSGCVSGHVGV